MAQLNIKQRKRARELQQQRPCMQTNTPATIHTNIHRPAYMHTFKHMHMHMYMHSHSHRHRHRDAQTQTMHRHRRRTDVPPSTYSRTIPRSGLTVETPRNRTIFRCDKPAFSLASAISSSVCCSLCAVRARARVCVCGYVWRLARKGRKGESVNRRVEQCGKSQKKQVRLWSRFVADVLHPATGQHFPQRR